ncbi:MAG: hypothetical protein WA366_26275 [Pseudolabrys sp.]
MFEAVCNLGLEGIVSKRLTSVYRSGPSRAWLKVKNPKSRAATRVTDGTFEKLLADRNQLIWVEINLMPPVTTGG